MAKAPSAKRLLIDKANAQTVIFVSVAAFAFIFCLVATKTLLSQAKYQNRVISAEKTVLAQLKADKTAAGALQTSYNAFNATAQNVIGGTPDGTTGKDGDNTKIVLDALPSKYDFLGLATSLNSLLSIPGVNVSGLGGSTGGTTGAAATSSATPQPVAIPINLTTTSTYAGAQTVISTIEKSIRPIKLQSLSLSGSQSSITMTIAGETYYQPAKQLNFSSQVVK